MQEDATFLEIINLCKENGFYKRRNAFFRVHGDGIVQILQYKKRMRPYPPCIDLNLGLYSMYGEIRPQELTPGGCVAKYPTHWLKPGAKEASVRSLFDSSFQNGNFYDHEVDVDFTKEKIIPLLNGMKTQQELAETMCFMDQHTNTFCVGRILWNDIKKYYPYLRAGNYKMAQKVIHAIVAQRESVRERHRQTWTTEAFENYWNSCKDEDRWINDLKELADSEDDCAIREYLDNNYRTNLKLTEPFRKTGRP